MADEEDMTKYAEQLIRAVARAFFTDEYVLVIDVLIRDRFLRDDDMGPRLQLGTKGLKKVLERLEKEMLVKKESGEFCSSLVRCCGSHLKYQGGRFDHVLARLLPGIR